MIKAIKKLSLLLVIFTCLPAVVFATPPDGSGVFSPEDFGPTLCVGCCDENGNQLPSDPVCGCDPVDRCGVCNGDGSSCGCELFDCTGKPFPDPLPYCHLDVNQDKRIDTADAELIIAYLNRNGGGQAVNDSNKRFNTTQDDDFITPRDSLVIINFLNRNITGLTKVDSCGVCGGSGKNTCGKCPNDPDFIEPTGPDGVCGCPDAIDYAGPYNTDCAVCTSLPKDSCGRCPGSNGYNEPCACPTFTPCPTCPAPSSCPTCPSTPVPSPSPTPTPTPQVCDLYRFDFNHYQVHSKSSKSYYDLSNANGLSCIASIAAGSGSSAHLWSTLIQKIGGSVNEGTYAANKKYVQCDGKWESPRYDKHNAHHMIGGGQKAGKKGTLTPGCSNGVLYLNDKCELQVVSDAKDKLQSNQCNLTGSFKVNSEVGTPISLVWSETTEEVPSTLVNFKLNPYSDKQSWLWRGSEALPLIVHDPEHKGNITSASQLFGSWTFGGNGFASLVEGSSKNTPWKDGYEALSLMDKNRDGKVSGAELDDLALWFDKNQDAVSQAGEVVRLSDVGIKTLYYKPDSREGSTIVASRGFEREVDGKTIVGKSIDWSEQSFEAGFGDLIENLKAGIKASNSDYPVAPRASSDVSKNAVANVAGSWAYSLEMPAEGSGILSFDPSEDGMLGVSLSQVEVRGVSGVNKQVLFNHFDVHAKSNAKGMIEVEFESTANSGATLKNSAVLSSDGMTLTGKTIVNGSSSSEKGSYEYKWVASRLK